MLIVTCQYAKGAVQVEDVGREHTGDETHAADERAHHGHHAAPVLIGEDTGDGAWIKQHCMSYYKIDFIYRRSWGAMTFFGIEGHAGLNRNPGTGCNALLLQVSQIT